MSDDPSSLVSAQVILMPASGKSVDPSLPITQENVAQVLPGSDTVRLATDKFRSLGFEVGPVVANSFSITAPTATFEKVFKVQVHKDEKGGLTAVRSGAKAKSEVPTDALPAPLRQAVVTVVFPRPPDFGPVSFGP